MVLNSQVHSNKILVIQHLGNVGELTLANTNIYISSVSTYWVYLLSWMLQDGSRGWRNQSKSTRHLPYRKGQDFSCCITKVSLECIKKPRHSTKHLISTFYISCSYKTDITTMDKKKIGVLKLSTLYWILIQLNSCICLGTMNANLLKRICFPIAAVFYAAVHNILGKHAHVSVDILVRCVIFSWQTTTKGCLKFADLRLVKSNQIKSLGDCLHRVGYPTTHACCMGDFLHVL